MLMVRSSGPRKYIAPRNETGSPAATHSESLSAKNSHIVRKTSTIPCQPLVSSRSSRPSTRTEISCVTWNRIIGCRARSCSRKSRAACATRMVSSASVFSMESMAARTPSTSMRSSAFSNVSVTRPRSPSRTTPAPARSTITRSSSSRGVRLSSVSRRTTSRSLASISPTGVSTLCWVMRSATSRTLSPCRRSARGYSSTRSW